MNESETTPEEYMRDLVERFFNEYHKKLPVPPASYELPKVAKSYMEAMMMTRHNAKVYAVRVERERMEQEIQAKCNEMRAEISAKMPEGVWVPFDIKFRDYTTRVHVGKRHGGGPVLVCREAVSKLQDLR